MFCYYHAHTLLSFYHLYAVIQAESAMLTHIAEKAGLKFCITYIMRSCKNLHFPVYFHNEETSSVEKNQFLIDSRNALRLSITHVAREKSEKRVILLGIATHGIFAC